jgi:hypothetical protein
LVNQDCATISQANGIGKFGLNCQQLEQTGYVKPGTTQLFLNADYATYLPNALNFVDLMNAPGIWTGKDGVQSLNDLLSNCDLQSQIYTQLMQNSYDSLTAAGVIQPPTTAAVQPITATIYSQSASQGGILSILDNTALLTGALAITPGVISLVGNLLSNTSSIGNTLSNVGSLVTGAVTNIGNTISNLAGNISLPSLSSLLDSSFAKTITGDLSALTINAAQFGTPLTSLWAGQGGLTNITGQIPNFNSLTGQIPNFNSLTSQLPSLDSLTSQLPSLDSLTSQLPSLDSLTASLPDLSGITDSLGSLGDLMGGFGAVSSFASAFGGGGGGESPGSLVSNERPAPAYHGTVNRSTVDVAVAKIIGNSKIPTPGFGLDSITIGRGLDIAYAQTILRTSSVNQIFGSTVTI